MLKIARLDDAFLELSFLTAGKSSRRSITAAKRKEKVTFSSKNYDNLKILISTHAWVKMSKNVTLVARKASGRVAKCIFDQNEANLAEIQPKNHQNVQKNAFFAKSSRSQWVKH